MRRSTLSLVLRGLALAAVYVAAGRLSRLCVPPDGVSAALWLPGGISLAGLVLLGPGYWPALALGIFVTHLTLGTPPLSAALSALLRALLWAGSAWLLVRRVRIRRGLSRVRDVLAFAGIGGGTAMLVGAAGWFAAGGGMGAPRWIHAMQWAAGTLAGALVCAPAVLAWSMRERPRPPGGGGELAAVLAVGAVTGEILFGPASYGAAELPLGYLVFPLVVWAATRTGVRGTASLSLVIATVAMARLAQGVPLPFQRVTADGALLAVQQYLSLVGLGGLVLAALSADRRRAAARERRARR